MFEIPAEDSFEKEYSMTYPINALKPSSGDSQVIET
jgi:hypothetical protein